MFQHNISGSMKMFVWNHILCKHYKCPPIVVCAPQGRRTVSNIWVVVVTSMRSCLTTLGHKVKVLAPHIRCGLAVSTIRSEWDRRVPRDIALCRVVGYCEILWEHSKACWVCNCVWRWYTYQYVCVGDVWECVKAFPA